MLWTAVGSGPATWDTGAVVRALSTKRRDNFTYDARLDASNAIRGVTLTEAGHIDGIWTPMQDAE
eukprot:5684075-Pleurochrysis_carterae.AAC.1